MLSLKNVKAGYGDTQVLHGITCQFEMGRNYCLLGPNGCGKTTLIRAIAGLIPSTGEITLEGVPLKNMKRLEFARHIAVMSQMNSVYFPYTVYETVMMGRYQHMKKRLFHLPSAEDRDMVQHCLETVRLADLKDRPIDELSGGQRQRVFLSQVLAQDPRIILLDEPTSHLDIRHQLELVNHLQQWSKSGRHMVIGVLHDINLALKLSEHILFMKDGNILRQGSFREIADGPFLKEVYEVDIVDYMQSSTQQWRHVHDSVPKPL